MAFPRGGVGLSSVCDCGIFLSHSITLLGHFVAYLIRFFFVFNGYSRIGRSIAYKPNKSWSFKSKYILSSGCVDGCFLIIHSV